MSKTKNYQHFCPVARSLEVIGEKWSLLIVRDLLRGPQRFTDLARYLGGITPKWLTLRLRELEAAGIVERESQPGRREVWYRLTPKGRDLAPVIESLNAWGIRHAMRPPRDGEPVHPEQVLSAVAMLFNRRGRRLDRPAAWAIRFGPETAHTLRFDGERWSSEPGEVPDADLIVTTTPRDWVLFTMAARDERRDRSVALRIEGPADREREFLQAFRVPAEAAT